MGWNGMEWDDTYLVRTFQAHIRAMRVRKTKNVNGRAFQEALTKLLTPRTSKKMGLQPKTHKQNVREREASGTGT